MHARLPLLLLALLGLPLSAAAPSLAPPPLPEALPLALEVAEGPPELTIGVPATLQVTLHSAGVAGTGVQPPVERKARLAAALDSDDPATVEPDPVVFPPAQGSAPAVVGFTPTRLGPLAIALEARWDTGLGNATARLARVVVKDTLEAGSLAAGEPDADLDVRLDAALRSGHLVGEPLSWRVLGEHVPRNGSEPLRWVAAEGDGTASPGRVPWAATVRARYGPGTYAFTLEAGGPRLQDARASVEVAVEEVRRDAGQVRFTLEVPDHPTTLRLASDSVNADGRAKAPGQALITRVVVGDANGLGDVRRVTFSYHRVEQAERVLVASSTHDAMGSGLERALEDRFDASPLKDGAYVAVVIAEGTGAPGVERTFAITDVQPEASLRLEATAWPARAVDLGGTLAVRDANFGTGPLDGSDVRELGELTLALYRGSARVTEAGWELAAGAASGPAPLALDLGGEGSRSTSFAYSVAGGKGQLEVPVRVRVPEGAAPGSYRLSVGANATLATATFEVQALPRIAKLALGPAAQPGAALAFEVEAAPAMGLVALELRAPWGAVLRTPVGALEPDAGAVRWSGTLDVPSPWDDDAPGALAAVADLGDGRVVLDPVGRPVNARETPVAVANAAPTLHASLRIGGARVGEEAWVHPHAAAALSASVAVGDANAMEPDLADEVRHVGAEVLDWSGQRAPFHVGAFPGLTGGDVPVSTQAAAPGRYALVLKARDDDGAETTRSLAIHVGAHFRLRVEAPTEGLRFEPGADGALLATLGVRNAGNAAAGALTLLVEGLPGGVRADADLALANGTRLATPIASGAARFEAPALLGPGESASVTVRVHASTGVRAGLYEGRIVVAGEAA